MKSLKKAKNLNVLLISNGRDNSLPDGKLTSLWKLRSIFRRRLPKVPLDYMTETMFDMRQQNIIVRQGEEMVAGISFRLFHESSFCELVFLAVECQVQLKGLGAILMDVLKQRMVDAGIKYILTYADNDAKGFFKKQGFSTDVLKKIDKRVYEDRIKCYTGATLMGFKLEMSQRYSKMIVSDVFQDDMSIQYASEDGCASLHGDGQEVLGAVLSMLRVVLDKLNESKFAGPFVAPVDRTLLPEYYEHVKKPMDLGTIRQKLETNQYTRVGEFTADIRLVFSNSYFFNEPSSQVFKFSLKMAQCFNRVWPRFFPGHECRIERPKKGREIKEEEDSDN